MSQTVTYQLSLKRTETRKIELPNLKSKCLLVRSFEIRSDQKTFDIKISGADTILSYGEAVFYQASKFDLSDKISQIVDAERVFVTIKNLCTSKEANNVNMTLIFYYTKMDDGNIIFNNIYPNLNVEGLSSIIGDITTCGKIVTKIIWTSPNKLSTIELIPQFETEPQLYTPIKEVVNGQNQVVMNLTDHKYNPHLLDQLKYYSLVLPDNLEKLGVIVYGYVK